jgi:hypothetical protein
MVTVFLTNRLCSKLVEKLKRPTLMNNSKPNGIFTANAGI